MAIVETRTRTLSLAVRLLDGITRHPLSGATVSLDDRFQALAKSSGFYTLADIENGVFELTVDAPGYQRFATIVTLPLPPTAQGLLRIFGENDLLQSVETVDRTTNIVSFAARDIPIPILAGTLVIAPQRLTITTGTISGFGVIDAPLADVGLAVDPTRIQNGDLLRFQRPATINLRPAASYPFPPNVRRFTGRILDSVDNLPVEGATVRIIALNSILVTSTPVGPISNRVDVFSIGTTPATRRVLGTVRDIESITDDRGSFCLSFPPRTDLSLTDLQIRISAPGYTTFNTANINISANMANSADLPLVRS